jgi:hypothetical protein
MRKILFNHRGQLCQGFSWFHLFKELLDILHAVPS